jgi:hypothetical protein
MRTPIICIALFAACSSTTDTPTEPDDPACAGESPPSARSEELPWDLDRDPVSDTPVCPADFPDCDRLDEVDAPDLEDPIVATPLEQGALTELSSTGKYRAWPKEYIDSRVRRHVDFQYCETDEALESSSDGAKP